jgi:hypothetical protein
MCYSLKKALRFCFEKDYILYSRQQGHDADKDNKFSGARSFLRMNTIILKVSTLTVNCPHLLPALIHGNEISRFGNRRVCLRFKNTCTITFADIKLAVFKTDGVPICIKKVLNIISQFAIKGGLYFAFI